MEKFVFEEIDTVLSESLVKQINEIRYSGLEPDISLILEQIQEYEEKYKCEFVTWMLGKFIFRKV